MSRFSGLKKAISRAFLTARRPNRFVFVIALVICSVDVRAQDLDISGTAWVTNWPEARASQLPGEKAPPLDYSRYELIPFIDSLAVHYRFSAASSDDESISMHFAIEWTEGNGGIVSGRRVDLERMPPGVVIESVDFLLDVWVGEDRVAEFYLPLDTIGLGPVPSMTFVDIENVSWDSVFVDLDETQTRQIFESGFQLSSPRLVHVAFAAEPFQEEQLAVAENSNRTVRRTRGTVFVMDPDVWIYWQGGRTRWIPPRGSVVRRGGDAPRDIGRSSLVGRARRDRDTGRQAIARAEPSSQETQGELGDAAVGGRPERTGGSETAGRGDENAGDSTRGGRDTEAEGSGGIDLGKLFDPKKDKDDDDEDRLYPAAIGGALMIGALAILGGTIGYSGSVSKAPIGFMSGYVEPAGGMLLQVSINNQVFGKAKGPENLIANLTGFMDVFNAPIQPAIGFGARFTEEGTNDIVIEPSISVGLAGNFGRLVILAGYDVTTPDFRFGIGVNLRHKDQ